MRKGMREAQAVVLMVLLGISTRIVAGEAQGSRAPIRLTVEVDWSLTPEPSPMPASGLGAPAVELELTEGRIIGVARLGSAATAELEPRLDGIGSLGSGPKGRARARIEAPIGACLLVRAGGQVVRVPILSVLEGPQRTVPQAPVNVGVERLSWDALEVSLASGNGAVSPGEMVPVNVAFNVLTPEPTEVGLRLVAELRPIRGDGALWRQELGEVVATNAAVRHSRVLTVPAPQEEGTYVLELRSVWEPLGAGEGSRLGRWLRRRRNAGATPMSVRRITLAVVAPKSPPPPPSNRPGVVVDVVDAGRPRGHRPSDSGRAPLEAPGHATWRVPDAALAEARRHDLLRGLINRGTPETALLGPAEATDLAWSAFGLKVMHPGRPHRLSLTVIGGHPSALGVALLAPAGPGSRARVLLDACASGMPILEGGPVENFSWLVWPDIDEPMLVLVNRGPAAVRLGTVELAELPDIPPPPVHDIPSIASARTLGLQLSGPHALDRFGGETEQGPVDALGLALNLAGYVASCGASSVVLPDDVGDRARRWSLDGQADEDPIGPDRLDLILRILDREGLTAWLEVLCNRPLPGLPLPQSPEALTRGLIRVDRRGAADGPTFHPLNPDVREALKRQLTNAIAPRNSHSSLTGLLVRLGPGPTLLGGPDTGFDDATFARFVRATGLDAAGKVPGLGSDDPTRFAARQQFLSGPGRMPWLTWRAREMGALYGDLARAVGEASPGASLAVVTPGLDDGPAGEEARRADLAGLPPHDAWRAVGLDLEHWPTGEGSPIVLRGVGLSTDDLGHDLATSPELDAQVAARSGRGLLLASEEVPRGPLEILCLTARPMADGAAGDELLGHALAALDARWVVLAANAVAGQEDRVRRFAAVFRALPASGDSESSAPRGPSGVAVRALEAGERTYLSLANDTPYPIRLETVLSAPASAPVTDLGRRLLLAPETVAGGKRLVLDLAPFGVAAVRVGAPAVRIATVTPHHPSAVLASLEARKNDLSGTLARLNRVTRSVESGPPNPGFEPTIQLTGARDVPRPSGWHAIGEAGTTAVIDPVWPRSGQGSLRLDVSVPPAGVVCDAFIPPAGSGLNLRAWLRSDRPNLPVRLRVEGDQDGRLFLHQVELTAQPQWVAISMPMSNLPANGLDRARLRFELLSPGRLWLDDLAIAGEGLSEPERRNARRTLLAALQAYRERRYADFARLAGSHWAHQAEPTARVAGLDPDRTGLRANDPTALPASRRLR